jgi:hypothetical protein
VASTTITVAPGVAATTTDSFTLQVDTGTDVLKSLVVSFAAGTATSTSLIEITDNAGSQVFGSVSTTTSDSVTIPVTGLTVTTATTTYKIRITPKSHINMPPSSVGTLFNITTYISDVTGSSISRKLGTDTTLTTVVVDNQSPENVDEFGVKWRIAGIPVANYSFLQSITYGNGLFVAIGCGNNCVGGYTVNILSSPDGITWTPQTAPADNAWLSVAYGNGLFVAVSNSSRGTIANRVMTSPDGITWTPQTAATNDDWRSVTYGNGLFVAVSENTGGVMTSPTGAVWTTRTSASSNAWQSVTYGNGLFVAVAKTGSGNRVMTSSDGIAWMSRASAADNSWYGVTYGNGIFLAVSNDGVGNRVMTSPDGITWTSRSGAIDNPWTSVTYGNGLFAAVTGDSSGTTMTSPDGVTWILRTATDPTGWMGITYGTSTLVAVGGFGYNSMVSRGPSLSATSSQVTVTSYSPSIIDLSKILVLRSTSPFSTSTTPVEGVSYATSSTIGGATAVCSVSIAASTSHTCTDTGLTNGTPYYYKIYTQDTSLNWSTGVEPVGLPISPGTTTVTLGVGVDTVGGTIAPGSSATTSDAFTFQTSSGSSTISSVTVITATTTASSSLSLVEITNNVGTVVYGSSTNPTSDTITIPLTMNTLTATSGVTQYKIRITPKSHINMPSPSVGSTYYITSYISSWVGSGTRMAGTDVSSSTATTTVISIDNKSPIFSWVPRISATNNSWSSVTYGNGLFVAVSASSTSNQNVMTSPDGVTWTLRTGTTTNGWSSVTYGNGLFVAVADNWTGGTINDLIMTSPDGVAWTSRTAAYSSRWSSVTYGGGTFVAVDYYGKVMSSPDGITWTGQTPSQAFVWWESVSYGNGLFVAVSVGLVMTSPDGITWTSRTVAANNWNSITYGNGLFVAVAFDGGVMTSQDGVTWTSRSAASNNSWRSITYGNGLFVAVAQSGSGNRVMTSSDGVTWSSGLSSADYSWKSIVYGTSTFVVVSADGTGNQVMTSPEPKAVSTSTQISITFTNPADSDISTSTILRSTSPVTDTPTEGVSYATSSTIGASTVACSFAVTASSTRTCTATGLTNGTLYYFKIFTQDTSGNWSTGLTPTNPASPGSKIITLGAGTSTLSYSISPGGSATTSDTFTLQVDTGTDTIATTTINFASSTSQALSLVEITNDAGSTVYGSVANPSSDTIAVPLTANTLTVTTTQTQYRVRVTPKTHTNMPVIPGSIYYVTSYISSINSAASAMTGNDQGVGSTTIITIDNLSPSAPSSVSGLVNGAKQSVLSFTNPSTSDATSTITLRSLSPVTDSPVEGVTYTAGNTIGTATVVCVNSNIVLSSAATCTDSTPIRGKSYYYKIFTKDNAGNYSTGVVPSGMPLKVTTEAAGIFIETEVQNGGTTVVTGGGAGSGGGTGNGSTTSGTTTQTGGGQGGGGGDSGALYHGSTVASLFGKAFDFLFGQAVAGGASNAYAEQPVPSSFTEKKCSLQVLGVCVVSNLPWTK